MKRLNNKGITTIEVILCFVIVVIITISMFSTVSSFNQKRREERNKEDISNYKETLTKDIQDDFIKIGLVNAQYRKETSPDKTTTYIVDCDLKDGTARRLEVIQRFTESTYHPGGSTTEDDYYMIKYGTPDDLVEYPIPDLGSFENKTTHKVVKDLSINNVLIDINEENILSIYIGFYHPELTTKYSINIVSPINYTFSPSGMDEEGVGSNLKCPSILVKNGEYIVQSNTPVSADTLNVEFTFDSSVHSWDWLTNDDGNEEGATYLTVGGSQYRLWNHYDVETTTATVTGEGNRNFLVYVYDPIGRVKECQYGTYIMDKTPPECPSATAKTADDNDYSLNNWTNQNIIVTFDFTPETVSWTYQTGFMNESTLSTPVQYDVSTRKVTLTTTGSNRIVTTVRDAVGNSQTCEYSGYNIDNSAPECPTINAQTADGAYSPGNWTNKDITLNFIFDADTQKWDWETGKDSGNYSTSSQNNSVNNNSYTFSSEGKNKGRMTIKDKVGNTKQCEFTDYWIDKTPPTCPSANATTSSGAYTTSTWTNKDITMTFNFDSDTDNWDWATGKGSGNYSTISQNISATVKNQTFQEDGKNKGKITVRDAVGNSQECEFTNYWIDKTPPACPTVSARTSDGAYTTGNWTDKDITVDFTFDSDTSSWDWATGQDNGNYAIVSENLPKTTKTQTFTQEGKNKGKVTVKDALGNQSICEFKDYWIDKDGPSITVINTQNPPVDLLENATELHPSYGSSTINVQAIATATDVGGMIEKVEYVFSKFSRTPISGWSEFTNGATLSFNRREKGDYYLHIRATDRSNKTATVTTKRIRVSLVVDYYDVNSSEISNTVYNYNDTSLTLRTPPNTTSGYTFEGWYTSDGTRVGGAGSAYMPPTSIKLYGRQRPNTYTISFDPNNGGVVNTMAPVEMTYDVAQNLPLNQFKVSPTTNDNQIFVGWEDVTNNTTYTDGQSVINLTSVDRGEVRLKAMWVHAIYRITNCGENNSETKFATTLADAVDLASDSGSTISLIREKTDSSTVTTSKSFTLHFPSYAEIGPAAGVTNTSADSGPTLTRLKNINITGGTVKVTGVGTIYSALLSSDDELFSVTGDGRIETSGNPTIMSYKRVIRLGGDSVTMSLNGGWFHSKQTRTMYLFDYKAASITGSVVTCDAHNIQAIVSEGDGMLTIKDSKVANGINNTTTTIDPSTNNQASAIRWTNTGTNAITGKDAVLVLSGDTAVYGTGDTAHGVVVASNAVVQCNGNSSIYSTSSNGYCLGMDSGSKVTFNSDGKFYAKNKYVASWESDTGTLDIQKGHFFSSEKAKFKYNGREDTNNMDSNARLVNNRTIPYLKGKDNYTGYIEVDTTGNSGYQYNVGV